MHRAIISNLYYQIDLLCPWPVISQLPVSTVIRLARLSPIDALFSLSLLEYNGPISQLFPSFLLGREHLSRKHVMMDFIVCSMVHLADIAFAFSRLLMHYTEGTVAKNAVI